MPDDWPTVVLTAEELAQLLQEAGEANPSPPPTDEEIEAMFKALGEPDPFKGE